MRGKNYKSDGTWNPNWYLTVRSNVYWNWMINVYCIWFVLLQSAQNTKIIMNSTILNRGLDMCLTFDSIHTADANFNCYRFVIYNRQQLIYHFHTLTYTITSFPPTYSTGIYILSNMCELYCLRLDRTTVNTPSHISLIISGRRKQL